MPEDIEFEHDYIGLLALAQAVDKLIKKLNSDEYIVKSVDIKISEQETDGLECHVFSTTIQKKINVRKENDNARRH